jgi:hypothetical protein
MKIKKRNENVKEKILNKIGEYDIYRFYFGEFRINRRVNNHLRGEKTPSFIIGNKYNNLNHFDFGEKYWRGDCFDLVQQINYCDFNTSLKIIDKDFGLGLFDSKVEVKTKEVITWKKPVSVQNVKPPLIQITTRKFNKKELDYWDQYYIGLDELKSENIYVPKSIYINGERKKFYEKELTFCYFSPEIQKWKIYCPESPEMVFIKNGQAVKLNKKWYSNIPFNYVEHLEKIENCDTVFIAKSKKDLLVLRKALETNCIIITQAEDPSCFSEELIQQIKTNSKTQVTVFDVDKKGKESSMWLTENYGFKHCNVPDIYLDKGITDFADLAREEGLNKVTKHFKEKGWI